eukprot:654988-Alexandrium_andersonii.AAC.1
MACSGLLSGGAAQRAGAPRGIGRSGARTRALGQRAQGGLRPWLATMPCYDGWLWLASYAARNCISDRAESFCGPRPQYLRATRALAVFWRTCLLYTSDAADDM